MDGDSMTNQQFAVLTQEQMERLGQKYAYEIWERHEDGRDVVRFCTSWATKDENVQALLADIAAL